MNYARRCNPELIAVSIFAYKRPLHLQQLFNFLKKNNLQNKYCFHIFVDSTTFLEFTNELVKEEASNFTRICSYSVLIIRSSNYGLFQSVVLGLNAVFCVHEQSIILEDDIIPSIEFFELCENGLRAFASDNEISTISGWNFTKFPSFVDGDYILAKRHSSWGWATWSNRWLSIDWNIKHQNLTKEEKIKIFFASSDLLSYLKLHEQKKVVSWATLLNINFILQGTRSVIPRVNLVENIGLDGSGTHNVSKKHTFKIQKKIELNHKKLRISKTIDKSKIYDIKICFKYSVLNNSLKSILYLLLSALNIFK